LRKLFFITGLIALFLQAGCSAGRHSDEQIAPRGFRNETLLRGAYAARLVALVDTEPEVPAELKIFNDLEYKNVDSVSLKLDIFRKADLTSPVPAVIFIHGGSWRYGKRSDYMRYLVDYAMKGYVTVTISYRLSRVATYPAAVQDVFCAVRWVRENAGEYGIDPERIALVGGSAGAHLSMLAAYAPDNPLFNSDCDYGPGVSVQAVVNFYGPVDLTVDFALESRHLHSFIGKSYGEAPELYREVSPKSYVSAGNPPTLTFHGTIDSIVPVSQADSLDSWLKRAGVIHEYHRLRGWPHALDMGKKVNEYCQYYIDRFFEKYL
jgi:acetyl esterase/lipase